MKKEQNKVVRDAKSKQKTEINQYKKQLKQQDRADAKAAKAAAKK